MYFKFIIIHFFFLLLLSFPFLPSLSTDFPPSDHKGADLTLQDGDQIWGKHYGIRNFEIPTTTTVYVFPYFPYKPNKGYPYNLIGTGFLEIHAECIKVFGIINSKGTAYTGRGGGGEEGGYGYPGGGAGA